MSVLATAGHVDHGKSTLVRFLTGTDPDRWAEEKERGLTIDLGFANLVLSSGAEISLIDVPGHIRFLRNMLAGVGAVDGCLFVVSAVEGWKPQSEEHLRILDLLGISHGVVALTMVDQVDDDLLELALMDVEEHIEGTFLEGATVVPVSAPTGVGLVELRTAVEALMADIGETPDQHQPRIWIDRAFAPSGAGTVITGTLTGGSLAVGDEVLALPGDQTARIRSLQSHHRSVERVGPGNRVAVNLTGISHGDLGRGHVLIRKGQWHRSSMIDAELNVLASLSHPVSRRGAYAAYLGSGEFAVKVRVLGPDKLVPGERGAVRLHFKEPVPVLPGDRFILRESGRDETVGGGQLLDIDPRVKAADAKPDRSVDRVIAERGWVTPADLQRLTGELRDATVGDWVVDPTVLEETAATILTRIEDAGPLGLDLALLNDQERALAEQLDDVDIEVGKATIGEPYDPLADHPWVAQLEAEPFMPPGSDGVDRAEVRELVRRGTVVEQDGVFFAASSLHTAGQLLAARFVDQPTGLTVAEVRDVLGTTRKFVLPLLNHFDRTGQTRRREDVRIAGPRLPDPVATSP